MELEEPQVDLIGLIRQQLIEAEREERYKESMNQHLKQSQKMNRAERREHNRRNGRNSDGSPKKRAL